MSDLISRRAAIDALNEYFVRIGKLKRRGLNEGEKAIRLDTVGAINSLPPAQPEQTGCEYCHEDADGYVKPIEKNGHAFVSFGMNGWELNLQAKGWHGEAKIQYCPMCGRKLKNDK